MKTTQFLGIAGALLTASCQQMQQMTLLERETPVRAPNGHWQQVVVLGDENGEGHYVSVVEYNNKKEMQAEVQKHPVGFEQRIIGWEGDGYAAEYIGRGGAVLFVDQHTK